MIKELTQPKGMEVLKIGDEVAAVGATSVAEESSQAGELLECLPLCLPNNNLLICVVADIVVIFVGDIAPTQIEEPLMGIGVGNIPSTSNHFSITIIETGPGSAPLVPTPGMDILKEFSLYIVR